jgi:hypothetical protein
VGDSKETLRGCFEHWRLPMRSWRSCSLMDCIHLRA